MCLPGSLNFIFSFSHALAVNLLVQEFLAICAHLPTELKDDLNRVAVLGDNTHRLTAELSRDQAEILEKAKLKYRQVSVTIVGRLALMYAANTLDERWGLRAFPPSTTCLLPSRDAQPVHRCASA